jgi:hypothetical protein
MGIMAEPKMNVQFFGLPIQQFMGNAFCDSILELSTSG